MPAVPDGVLVEWAGLAQSAGFSSLGGIDRFVFVPVSDGVQTTVELVYEVEGRGEATVRRRGRLLGPEELNVALPGGRRRWPGAARGR
jgi:hypothetical protein